MKTRKTNVFIKWLNKLKDKTPECVLPLVHQVFRKFNDFEKDVSVYRKVRKELLELLEL